VSGVDWAKYRADWPHVAEGVVWLQHAGITPPCRRVMGAAIDALEGFAQRPDTYRTLWHASTGGARAKVAAFLGAPENTIALVKNTSVGLTFIAESFPFVAGDSVVTLAGEFPSNRLPWRVLERKGVEVRTVEARPGLRFTVDQIAGAMDARTRVVAVSWVQYLNGFRLDLATLAEACAQHGAYLVVDGVQGVGVLPVDLTGVDAMAVGGHKWLCGTEGAGFLYVAPRLLERLGPFNVSWYSVEGDLFASGREVMVEDGLPTLKSGAVRFEEATPNAFGNVMLGEAVTMLAEIGAPAIWEKIRGWQDELLERLAPLGYASAGSMEPGERSAILPLVHETLPPAEIVRRLAADRIVTIQRGEACRLAPHFYNDGEDLERVVAALAG
jgi:selenocysteine lyase/cysteine desulfurase